MYTFSVYISNTIIENFLWDNEKVTNFVDSFFNFL